MPDKIRQHKTIAGWLAFAAAIVVTLLSTVGRFLGRTGDHTEVLGIVGAMLAYSAACFGLKTFETIAKLRTPSNASD